MIPIHLAWDNDEIPQGFRADDLGIIQVPALPPEGTTIVVAIPAKYPYTTADEIEVVVVGPPELSLKHHIYAYTYFVEPAY